MLRMLRPAAVVAVLPVLILICCGCSGQAAEAAPLNVAAINSIKAYHVKLDATVRFQSRTLTVTQTEDIVAPDRARGVAIERIDGNTTTTSIILVGDRFWQNSGTDWQVQTIDPSLRQALTNASMQICTAFKGLPAHTEKFRGRQAVHYSTRGTTADTLSAAFNQFGDVLSGPGIATADAHVHVLNADLWTTVDGAHPLRITMKVSATTDGEDRTAEMQADYSDIDGSDIDIEPPQ